MLDYHLEEECFESPENYGYIATKDLPDLQLIKDSIKEIVKAVYKSGDVFMLESHLDEICSELEVERGTDSPVIQNKTSNMLNWHHAYQRATINNLNNIKRSVI